MWNRAAQTLTSIKTSAVANFADLAAVGRYLFGAIKRTVTSKEFQKDAFETSYQTVEGLSPLAMGALPKAALKYPDSQPAIASAVLDWSLYAVPVITYYAGIRPAIWAAVEGTSAYYPFYAVEGAAVVLYFGRSNLSYWLDSLLHGLTISQTTTPKPDELKHDHELLVPCTEKCGAFVNFQASMLAQVNNFAAIKATQYADYTASTLFLTFKNPVVPILGTFVTFPFLRLIEGRTLVGYELAAVGICADHREEILSANNGVCFGKGLSYYTTLQLLSFLSVNSMRSLVTALTCLSETTCVNLPTIGLWDYFILGIGYSFIVQDALSNLVWLSFSVAEVQITNVLPGKEKGIEWFYWINRATKYGYDWLVDKITSSFTSKEPENNEARGIHPAPNADTQRDKVDFTRLKSLAAFFQKEPVRMLLTYVNSDLLSLAEFRKRRSMQQFTKIYGPIVHAYWEWFKEQRAISAPRSVLERVPESVKSSTSIQLILELRKKRWDDPVKKAERILHDIFPTEFTHLSPVASSNALDDLEAEAKRKQDQPLNMENASELEVARLTKSLAESSDVKPEHKEPSSAVASQDGLMGVRSRKKKAPANKNKPANESWMTDELRRLTFGKDD